MEEKAISDELVELCLQSEQQRHADFLGIKPFGNLLALIDSDVLLEDGFPLKLFESGAILLHLAEIEWRRFRSIAPISSFWKYHKSYMLKNTLGSEHAHRCLLGLGLEGAMASVHY